jgi:hypothetical protein
VRGEHVAVMVAMVVVWLCLWWRVLIWNWVWF